MVDDLLSGIKDDVDLEETSNQPILNLYEAYLELQDKFDLERRLPNEPKGSDLKTAVRSLPSDLKLRLINQYVADIRIATEMPLSEEVTGTPKSAVDRIWEDRPLRRWIVKVLIISVIAFFFVLVGTVLTIGYLTGKITDGTFINTLMNTAVEVLKIIFGVGV